MFQDIDPFEAIRPPISLTILCCSITINLNLNVELTDSFYQKIWPSEINTAKAFFEFIRNDVSVLVMKIKKR